MLHDSKDMREKVIKSKLKGHIALWKDEIIEEITRDNWKVEVATAFVGFIQEYSKFHGQEARYAADLRAPGDEWKKLAFANFYVRRC